MRASIVVFPIIPCSGDENSSGGLEAIDRIILRLGILASSETRIDDLGTVLGREVYRLDDVAGRKSVRISCLDRHDPSIEVYAEYAFGIIRFGCDSSGDMRPMIGIDRIGVLIVVYEIISIQASSKRISALILAVGTVPHLIDKIRMIISDTHVDHRHYGSRDIRIRVSGKDRICLIS